MGRVIAAELPSLPTRLVASFHGSLSAASRAILEFGRARYAPASLG
jgi:hypothetical protein